MSRGAISLLRASTGLLSIEGHAEVVAARSRTEERTAEGFMAAPNVYACTVESPGCPREGVVWSYGESSETAAEGRVACGYILETPCNRLPLADGSKQKRRVSSERRENKQ